MFLAKFLFKVSHLMNNGSWLIKHFAGIETIKEIINAIEKKFDKHFKTSQRTNHLFCEN